MEINEKQIAAIISKAESLANGKSEDVVSLLSNVSTIEKIAKEVIGKISKDDLSKIMTEVQKSAIFKAVAGDDGKLDAGDIINGINTLKKIIK